MLLDEDRLVVLLVDLLLVRDVLLLVVLEVLRLELFEVVRLVEALDQDAVDDRLVDREDDCDVLADVQ